MIYEHTIKYIKKYIEKAGLDYFSIYSVRCGRYKSHYVVDIQVHYAKDIQILLKAKLIDADTTLDGCTSPFVLVKLFIENDELRKVRSQ